MNTTAEALTTGHAEYDPDLDPALDARPRIRIRFRKPSVPRSKPASKWTKADCMHDQTYTSCERSQSLSNDVDQLNQKLQKLPDDASASDAIGVLGALLERLLENSDGLAAVVQKAWDTDVTTIEYLTRACGWIQGQQGARVTAGEA